MSEPVITGPVLVGSSCSVLARVWEFRRLTYRALVLQSMRTELPPVWQAVDDDGDDLLTYALHCPCVGVVRRPCRHWDLCLAAAVWLDTPDEWAAGIDRAARVAYFAELERVACGVDPWIEAQQPLMTVPGSLSGGSSC